MSSNISMSVSSNTTSQVFIWGIKPVGLTPDKVYTYTAQVNLETATIDDLFKEISFRTGIQMPLLRFQFSFVANLKLLSPQETLASQGVKGEDSIRLKWQAGLTDDTECPICWQSVSYVAKRMLFCEQKLGNGTKQWGFHRETFHIQCIEQLEKDGRISCPLCRGQVTPDSLGLP